MGKFTSSEVEALIDRLQREAEEADHGELEPPAPKSVPERPLRDAPTELLIAELHERGWRCSR
jgi:hypothetical protein